MSARRLLEFLAVPAKLLSVETSTPSMRIIGVVLPMVEMPRSWMNGETPG